MADDDRSPDADDDPDRAAILARRQRFVAIALSGLAATASEACRPQPHPCLNVVGPEEPQPDAPQDGSETPPAEPPAETPVEEAPTETSAAEGPEANPTPCLNVVRPKR